jgi:transcriptional regulator with XRE-family HTH domain
MPHIGIEVKERRIKNYWTIDDLAKESKVSKGTIVRIESCKENYSINSVRDIFKALGREVVVSTKRIKR